VADQSLIMISELDGSGNPTYQTRSLKSGDTAVIPGPGRIVGLLTLSAGLSLAANQAIAGAGAFSIEAAADSDITVKMGDAAGAQKVSFTDSADSEVASLDSDGNFGIDGNLIIGGNLTVNGTSTTVEGTTVQYEDSLFLFAKNASGAPSLDVGFIGERGDSQNVFFGWDESADKFIAALCNDTGTTGTITVADYADFHVGGMEIDDTMTVGGGSTFTGVADFDAGITLAGGQAITGDGGLTIENGGAASIQIIPADQLNVTFADDAGAKKLNFYNNAISVVASIDSAGAIAAKSLALTSGATVTAILDEDDLSSDSATALATQQSVKAYIDAAVGSAIADGSEALFEGYTAAGTNAAANNLFAVATDDTGLKARLPDVSSGSGSFALSRVLGVWRTGGKVCKHGRCAAVLVEDDVDVNIGDELVLSVDTPGRVTVAGATGAPAAGEFLVVVGWAESNVTGGTDQTVKASLHVQRPVQL
jgi:hypothetical protein